MKFENISESVAEYVIGRKLCELSVLTRYKIANHFGINQNYFSEKFKEGTGMTVLEFLTFEKMKRAEELLKTRPDLSVRIISHLMGIVKPKQFRTKFKKVFGVKPGKYREILKRRHFGNFYSYLNSTKLIYDD